MTSHDARRLTEQRMSGSDRDRDVTGRARQARPRDALGRPLPYGASGVEPVSEDPLPPHETVAEAWRLIAEGRPFSAHEVLEARWKAGPPQERHLWQGLAQICVGLTHAARGNGVGAVRLVERGAGRLQEYERAGGPTYGLDLPAVRACAERRVSVLTDDRTPDDAQARQSKLREGPAGGPEARSDRA
jgi:uncharacterized protein